MSKRLTFKPAAVALALTLFSIVYSFSYTFFRQNFALDDDEGMLMITIRRFLEGRALYDDISTIYGPFYYFYEWAGHILMGVPVSHESVRWISMAFWVAATVLVFVLVYRATSSLLLAAAAHFLALRALELIGMEPSHPQELCIFLLVAFGIVVCAIPDTTVLIVAAGGLVGAMAVTKINLGAFGIIALTLTLLFAMRPGRWRSGMLSVSIAGALAFPVLLLWGHHGDWWAQKFIFVTMTALAAALLIVSREKLDRTVTFRHFAVAAAAFAAVAAAFCWFAIAHGSSLHRIVELLILQPQRSFGHIWYMPSRIPEVAAPAALAGLAGAWAAMRGRLSETVLAILKMALAAGIGLLSLFSLYDAIFSFAPPFLWLAAIRPGNSPETAPGSFSRALLVLITVIQTLYAYPAAGTQVPFATILMLALAGICVVDALPVLKVRFDRIRAVSESPLTTMWCSAALIVLYIFSTGYTFQDYRAAEPLGLPGTAHIRILKPFAETVRTVSAGISSSGCTMLASAPGLLSFNFFTGKPAPHWIDYSTWMLSLSDARQQETIAELSREPYPCVLYSDRIMKFWTNGADVSSGPLLRFMLKNFTPTLKVGDYELMEPRNRLRTSLDRKP